MGYFLLGLVVLTVILVGARSFSAADTRAMAKTMRKTGGYGGLGLAALLAVTGRIAIAIPIAAFSMILLGKSSPFGFTFPGAPKSEGQTSTVRTDTVEMTLDHDSGNMLGRIVTGQFAGRTLDTLSVTELIGLWQGARASDPQGAQLLAAYLDRRNPNWREGGAGAGDAGQGGEAAEAARGPMTREEALEILGLKSGASVDDIRQAHRTLMKKLHPDQGGSTYLATKINQAKDLLLKRAGA